MSTRRHCDICDTEIDERTTYIHVELKGPKTVADIIIGDEMDMCLTCWKSEQTRAHVAKASETRNDIVAKTLRDAADRLQALNGDPNDPTVKWLRSYADLDDPDGALRAPIESKDGPQ